MKRASPFAILLVCIALLVSQSNAITCNNKQGLYPSNSGTECIKCPQPWGWNGCGNKTKPQVFMGFVGLSGEDAVRAKTGEGWEYLAQRLDGVFLNLVGSDLDSRRGIYSRIVSKRAVLPHHLINGLDAPSVKASLREMARYNFTMAGAVLTSWGGLDPRVENINMGCLSPKTLIPVKAAFAKKVPPIKKFFINVKTSVALWYSIRQPDKAVIAASDGAVVELAACRAFHRGRQNDTLGEMDYQLQRFVPAMRKLAKEKRKNLKAIWQMVIHKTCPQLGTTNPIPMDIKKAYFYLKERNALPDTFYVLNYVDDVDIFPENDGKEAIQTPWLVEYGGS